MASFPLKKIWKIKPEELDLIVRIKGFLSFIETRSNKWANVITSSTQK